MATEGFVKLTRLGIPLWLPEAGCDVRAPKDSPGHIGIDQHQFNDCFGRQFAQRMQSVRNAQLDAT